MSKKPQDKAIWIYAVILFTSAFVVILLTGYSQSKFNESINEFRSKLSSSQKESNKFQHNLSSALTENKKLNDEITQLQQALDKEKEKSTKSSTDSEYYKKNHSFTIENYEKLLKADSHIKNGEYKEGSLILIDEINTYYLSDTGKEKYNNLVNTTYERASLDFYKEGYSNYIDNKYSEAITSFRNSLKLANKTYYTDDCYYFIAYSYYNLNNKEEALKALKYLLGSHSDSSYAKEALILKDILENKK